MLSADVPVGGYLSGGLDSSLIAALGAARQGRALLTLSHCASKTRSTTRRCISAPWPQHIGSDHHDVVVSRGRHRAHLPRGGRSTPSARSLRTAPAPLYLLSQLVQRAGIKVVLTGEGADEIFGGYDLFREAKVRRFWARQPDSAWRPRLLERLYPYLVPVTRVPARDHAPVLRAAPRRSRRAGIRPPGRAGSGTAALKRLFSPDLRGSLAGVDAVAGLVGTLPGAFAAWTPLAQDQYLEIQHADVGLPAVIAGRPHVDGAFGRRTVPVPRSPRSVRSPNRCRRRYQLRVLDEKRVLKDAAADLVPESVLRRPKQPYRAPDALSFASPAAAEWIDAITSDDALAAAGVFAPSAGRALIAKCRAQARAGQFSNSDNMSVVGLLYAACCTSSSSGSARARQRRRSSARSWTGSNRTSWRPMVIDKFLRRSAQRAPDSIALIEPGRSVTYGELDQLTDRFANRADPARRAARRPRSSIAIENSVEFVAVYLGTLRAGAVAVPLTAGPRSDRVAKAVSDATPKAAVVDAATASDAASRQILASVGSVFVHTGAHRPKVDLSPALDLREVMAAADTRPAGRCASSTRTWRRSSTPPAARAGTTRRDADAPELRVECPVDRASISG